MSVESTISDAKASFHNIISTNIDSGDIAISTNQLSILKLPLFQELKMLVFTHSFIASLH